MKPIRTWPILAAWLLAGCLAGSGGPSAPSVPADDTASPPRPSERNKATNPLQKVGPPLSALGPTGPDTA